MTVGRLVLVAGFVLASALPSPAVEPEVFHPSKARLAKFPREIPENGAVSFVVTLGRGYYSPVLVLTHPDGSTEYLRPTRTPVGGGADFEVGFKAGAGAYRVELVVDSSGGDTTAAQFTIWAGVKRPSAAGKTDAASSKDPEGGYRPEPKAASTIRLERKLFFLMNGFRRKHGLDPYPWLEQAAILARAHVTDYLALDPRPKRFLHVIPGKGSIADRFERVFDWPETVRKFPIAEPDIGPEAVCYCSESLAAPRSLTWLFKRYFLREAAFRAPIVSRYPTHAAVGIVRDEATGYLYTATVFVQVNSTRVRAEMKRKLVSMEHAEARARTNEARAKAIRELGRYADAGAKHVFAHRLHARSAVVRAAALDALFLNDPEAAAKYLHIEGRILLHAFEKKRYGPAIPILETFRHVEYDFRTRTRGSTGLARIADAAMKDFGAALDLLGQGEEEKARAAFEEIVAAYPGLPAAEVAASKLKRMK